jgi:ADP-ribosylation factor related protein 1
VEYRLLLVGLDKGGKTSCLEKLRAFQLAPKDTAATSAAASVQLPVAPTVGLNIARFELAGCKLTLWDLGGQARGGERCLALHHDSGLTPRRWQHQAGLRSIWEKYYGDTHALMCVPYVATLPVCPEHSLNHPSRPR